MMNTGEAQFNIGQLIQGERYGWLFSGEGSGMIKVYKNGKFLGLYEGTVLVHEKYNSME